MFSLPWDTQVAVEDVVRRGLELMRDEGELGELMTSFVRR